MYIFVLFEDGTLEVGSGDVSYEVTRQQRKRKGLRGGVLLRRSMSSWTP